MSNDVKTHVVVIERDGKIIRCVGPFTKTKANSCKQKLGRDVGKGWHPETTEFVFRVINCWPDLNGPADER